MTVSEDKVVAFINQLRSLHSSYVDKANQAHADWVNSALDGSDRSYSLAHEASSLPYVCSGIDLALDLAELIFDVD